MFKVIDLYAGTQSFKKGLTEFFKVAVWVKQTDLNRGITYMGHTNEYGLGKPVVSYKPFDIKSVQDENNILDLSTDTSLAEIIENVGKEWKPDFIWASPVCNKVSLAMPASDGNANFIIENNEIKVRRGNDFASIKHNRICDRPEKWNEYTLAAEKALRMHMNTKKIVEHYKCEFAIENPERALSRYIYKEYKRNVAHYCAYGYEYKKATAIYSNFPLILKKHSKDETHIHRRIAEITSKNYPSHWNEFFTIYENRSSVPPKLVEEILNQYHETKYKEGKKW